MPSSKGSHCSDEGYTQQKSNMLADCDDEDRMGFVRKVYGILAVQLTITFGFVALVKTNESLETSLLSMPWLYIIALVLGFSIQCAILCCRSVARSSPMNYILLFTFTLCWTFLVGFICATYDAAVVISAAMMTMVLTISLTLYAWFTTSDFTQLCGRYVCLGLLMIICISMTMSLLSMLVFEFTDTYIPFAAGFGVIIYGLFLLIDTQMVAGGRKYELSIDDYVVGALILYLDIVMIFLELLRVFGGR